jgi:hypothetical protein
MTHPNATRPIKLTLITLLEKKTIIIIKRFSFIDYLSVHDP